MRSFARTLALALLGAACASAPVLDDLRNRPHQTNAGLDWRDQIIYQVLIDRFDDGDPNNDINIDPSAPARYHGGDWRGLVNHLDYLQDLGVTTLWISPVVKNVESDAGFASYHGYWTQDFLATNPHFGDLADLRNLVDQAHSRGMLVLLDVVVNHVGQLFYYDINGNGQADDFQSGGGTSHTCVQICDNPALASMCSPDELIYCQKGASYFERIIEWDPEFDPRGIQGWTSEGYSGPAEIRFPDLPDNDRTKPPRPPAFFGWPDDKSWFDDPSWYHRKGRVYLWWHESDYSKDFVREQETEGDFPGGLKDLNTDNPDVQDALARVFEFWMDVGDFDGFRVDTLKHIDRPEKDPNVRGFWGVWNDEIRKHAAAIGKQNFFVFGEAFDGNDVLDGSYTFPGTDAKGTFGRMDSVFYFSQKFRVIDEVFANGGPTRNIACLYGSRMGVSVSPPGDTWCADHGFPAGPTIYGAPVAPAAQGGIGLAPNQVMVNFLDNHDLPRFLFYSQPAALVNALTYLYTWDGIPCLYYGTEQEFAGGNDPRNREDMFAGNPDKGFAPFDTTHATYQTTKALIALRKAHVALRRGTVAIKWATDSARGLSDSGIFAFERQTTDETVLVVLNTADTQPSTTCAPATMGGACMKTSFPAGTVLTDVGPGGGTTATVAADGTLSVTVPARGSRIYVKK